jgi:Zn-dependent protease with chaperone function
MDFFASQELARRNTVKLVVLLVISIIAIVGAVFIVVLVGMHYALKNDKFLSDPFLLLQAFFWTALAVMTVIGIGMAIKFSELSRGGEAIANMVGGRRLLPNSANLAERRLLNVVEEMALAAGMPVPPVYVLEGEQGINAFAAGQTVDDAIIGINKGTLETLNRDELQGVIGHEFSHILNGDMRMSLHLIGILHGIQAIALIGYMLIRIVGNSGGRSSSKDNKGDPRLFLLAAGAALLAIGSVGLLCARLIKASISRQREFLADASSVQFTRNPEGIGGALKMIAVASEHSRVKAANAESISHMFFADMLGRMASGLMGTHPPLDKRILKVEPRFDGDLEGYLKSRAKATIADAHDESRTGKKTTVLSFPGMPGIPGLPGVPGFPAAAGALLDPLLAIDSIGSPTDDDVVYSQILIGQIPTAILEAARDVFSARCIVFAFLFDAANEIRSQQLTLLEKMEGTESVRQSLALLPMLNNIDVRYRMPIFEIIQGTLVGLSNNQFLHFRRTISELIAADQKINLFEFFLRHHLVIHLDRHFGHGLPHPIKHERVTEVGTEIGFLLSVLSRVGHNSEQEAAAAYSAGIETIRELHGVEFSGTSFEFSELARSITVLSHGSPSVKKQVLAAAMTTISFDHVVTVEEAELFRAMSESLDCPVPPLLASHRAAKSRV